MREPTLKQILDELRELRSLIESARTSLPNDPNDLVGPEYIAKRTGLAARTVRDGKAGTDAIPRALLNANSGKRSPVRFRRADADRFIRSVFTEQPTQQKALRLLNRKSQRRRARAA